MRKRVVLAALLAALSWSGCGASAVRRPAIAPRLPVRIATYRDGSCLTDETLPADDPRCERYAQVLRSLPMDGFVRESRPPGPVDRSISFGDHQPVLSVEHGVLVLSIWNEERSSYDRYGRRIRPIEDAALRP